MSRDLVLDPMTLIYEDDLDILKMYLHSKNDLLRSRLSKVKEHYGHDTGRSDRKHLHAEFAVGIFSCKNGTPSVDDS